MKITKDDGTIEFGASSCFCCPPGDRRGGVHLNAFSQWFRTSGGEWQRIELNVTWCRQAAARASSVAAFLQTVANQ